MQKIWKYELAVIDTPTIAIPEGGRILCVQMQGTKPHLWVLVDPSAPLQTRTFRVYGTGHEIRGEGNQTYVGTFQWNQLVFHVFEVG